MMPCPRTDREAMAWQYDVDLQPHKAQLNQTVPENHCWLSKISSSQLCLKAHWAFSLWLRSLFSSSKSCSPHIMLWCYLVSQIMFLYQQNEGAPHRGFLLTEGRAEKVYGCREKEARKVTVYLEDSEKRSHHLGSQSLLFNEQSLI